MAGAADHKHLRRATSVNIIDPVEYKPGQQYPVQASPRLPGTRPDGNKARPRLRRAGGR